MPFMVIYSTSDGASCYEQADAIDEAALFVERLRNQDGIDQIRIFRMEEISFAFRPYYKVELGLPERQSAERAPAPGSLPPVDDMGPAEPEAAEVDASSAAPVEEGSAAPVPASPDGAVDGRRGLFGR
jgi:hypothetical protein